MPGPIRSPISIREWTQRHRWVWALAGVLMLWAILSLVTSRFSLSSLSGVAMSSSFLVIAALGQMAVITTGRGNIDLSIANVIALSAYVGLIVVAGQDGRVVLGLAAVLGIGLVVGSVNAFLVVRCRIPAIIATLATGYILATATLQANRVVSGFIISPVLRALTSGRVGGVPAIVIVAAVLTTFAAVVLNRTVFGRLLSAVGQNMRAARLAGVKVDRVVTIAFLISAILAAVDGLLIGAYVGGAFLEIGAPYLLQSLGAVVLGGSLIFGGASTAVGTLFGGMLLILIVTTMQVAGLPAGTQDIVQGIVVIGVLALAGASGMRRRAGPATQAGTDAPVAQEA